MVADTVDGGRPGPARSWPSRRAAGWPAMSPPGRKPLSMDRRPPRGRAVLAHQPERTVDPVHDGHADHLRLARLGRDRRRSALRAHRPHGIGSGRRNRSSSRRSTTARRGPSPGSGHHEHAVDRVRHPRHRRSVTDKRTTDYTTQARVALPSESPQLGSPRAVGGTGPAELPGTLPVRPVDGGRLRRCGCR